MKDDDMEFREMNERIVTLLEEGHFCPPGPVEPKWDRGNWALLCGSCRVIVGYMRPSPDVEHVAKKARIEGARKVVTAVEDKAPYWDRTPATTRCVRAARAALASMEKGDE